MKLAIVSQNALFLLESAAAPYYYYMHAHTHTQRAKNVSLVIFRTVKLEESLELFLSFFSQLTASLSPRAVSGSVAMAIYIIKG